MSLGNKISKVRSRPLGGIRHQEGSVAALNGIIALEPH